MSGIFGVFYRDGRPVESEVLEQMLQSLAHRGPDGGGLWNEGAVGLGHQMLHTTPESLHEELPFVHRSGDLVITADARIDNRDELLRLLDFSGRPKAEVADSELILAAYERWGEDCPEKLIGDFAFAIWDKRQQKLFCARDPMGVKPYFYYCSDRVFVFASEIKAILKVPGVPRQLNELRVAEYLVKDFDDRSITFYQNILRLPADHCLSINDNDICIDQYWMPDLSSSLKLKSAQAYADTFNELFLVAVQCRLRSAFPVGSMLSGGLDTSSIVAVAEHLLKDKNNELLHTFSAVFPGLATVDPRIDERRYVDAVLINGNYISHFICADRLNPLLDLHWRLDEPIAAVNLYMDHAIFSVARQAGVRIVLSGIDGDSTVTYGYELIPKLLRSLRLPTFYTEVSALADLFGLRRRRVAWLLGLKPLFPQQTVEIYRSLQNRPLQDGATLINDEFTRKIGIEKRSEQQKIANSVRRHSFMEDHWQSLMAGLIQYGMEAIDRASVANEVDVRFPFFDRRLIEFCLKVPLEQRLRQGMNRAVFRQAMVDFLPSEVRSRISKANLSAGFKSGLLEKKQADIEMVVRQESEQLKKYVDQAAVHAAYRRYQKNPLKREQDALNLFLIIVLGRWLSHWVRMP
jgi:asparagine synthase (glutamine-hydrolysing)